MSEQRSVRIGLSATGVVVDPVDRRLDGAATAAWNGLVLDVVQAVWRGRDVWVALRNYRKQKSLANLPAGRALPLDGYRVWRAEQAASDLIGEAAAAWEFRIGWLWLMAARSAASDEVRPLLSLVDELNQPRRLPPAEGRDDSAPVAQVEACGMLADGAELWWLHPEPTGCLVEQIAAVVTAAGWAIRHGET